MVDRIVAHNTYYIMSQKCVSEAMMCVFPLLIGHHRREYHIVVLGAGEIADALSLSLSDVLANSRSQVVSAKAV